MARQILLFFYIPFFCTPGRRRLSWGCRTWLPTTNGGTEHVHKEHSMISLRHKTVMLAAAWALLASAGCTPPVESEEAQAQDGEESDEVIGTAAEGISVSG